MQFQDKYRIETARLDGYDYTSPGWYHTVICTKGRKCMLGKIKDDIVGLSEAGCVVAEEWQKTPRIRPYVELDAWIIMPNHVHGIIGISTSTPAVETPRRGVSTNQDKPLKPHSLGAIIGQIKTQCTKRIRAGGFEDFAWQPRFYDRVIRNERERLDTRTYIRDNPLNWHQDPYHPRASA